MKALSLFIIMSWAGCSLAVAQSKVFDLGTLHAKGKLTVVNRTITQEKQTIKVSESSGEGLVWLDDALFSEGVIEIDLKGQDVFQKSFLGIAFHGQNDSTYDAVYFRPFNFHAKDSIRKIHAVQYIHHPHFTWKKLREERNGLYEKEVVNAPDPNAWFHARIEIKGSEIRVYANGASVPSLLVKKLNANKTGKIGLWVGDGSGGEFSSLKITTTKKV